MCLWPWSLWGRGETRPFSFKKKLVLSILVLTNASLCIIFMALKYEGVAQLVEQRPFKPWALGSSPSTLTIFSRL